MNFEIPVMLSPGEILSVNRTSNFSTDGVLDLHVQAVVKNPKNKNVRENSCQTDRLQDYGKATFTFIPTEL